MKLTKKQIHIAQEIQTRLSELQHYSSRENIDHVVFGLKGLHDLSRILLEKRSQLSDASSRGLRGAEGRISRRLKNEISEILEMYLSHASDRVKDFKSAERRGAVVPSVWDVMRELDHLLCEDASLLIHGKYGEIQICKHVGEVVFERKGMDDLDLGGFEVVLTIPDDVDIRRRGIIDLLDRSVRIEAVDPNYSSEGDYYHPHVSNGRLCWGDARVPACRAVEEGRFIDFFDIVASTLKTYNPDSPYLDIDIWEGVPILCRECGDHVHEDEEVACHYCGDATCPECRTHCLTCNESYCDSHIAGACSVCMDPVCVNCLIRCNICEDRTCSEHCTHQCLSCGSRVCPGCWDTEEDECVDCAENTRHEREEQESEDEEQTEAQEEDQEVQPVAGCPPEDGPDCPAEVWDHQRAALAV